jgi:DNA modification methylase
MRIIHGDCLAFLPSLPDKSIHCCISSPPYFNKRDYQTGKWVGGDPACEHVSDGRYYTMRGASSASGEAFAKAGEQNATRLKEARWRERGRCQCVFAGTGTSAHAALKHGRDAILIELNADYIRLAEQRLAGYLHPAIKFAADSVGAAPPVKPPWCRGFGHTRRRW